MKVKKFLRPDSKGRICLGAIAKGISGYKAIINENSKEILLKPYAEIEFSEQWLFENKEALNKVKRGLTQSANKKTVYKGSFLEYINDDENDL